MNSAQADIVRALLGAAFLVLAGSLALLPIVDVLDLGPSPELLRALAQVGATLLIAYAVEVSWLLKVSSGRNGHRAGWVGYATGVGACGLLGLTLALVLSEADTSSLGLGSQFLLAWVAFSLALLGLLVALLPLLVYEWAHAARTEYPDE